MRILGSSGSMRWGMRSTVRWLPMAAKQRLHSARAWNEWLWVASAERMPRAFPLPTGRIHGRQGTWWRQIAPPEGEVGGDGVQDPMDVSIIPSTRRWCSAAWRRA